MFSDEADSGFNPGREAYVASYDTTYLMRPNSLRCGGHDGAETLRIQKRYRLADLPQAGDLLCVAGHDFVMLPDTLGHPGYLLSMVAIFLKKVSGIKTGEDRIDVEGDITNLVTYSRRVRFYFMETTTTFLHTNNEPPNDKFFLGYCFLGPDFVYSHEGSTQLYEETGQKITPALDGCYVITRKDNDSFLYDVDFAGYCILYYYHDGDTWIVSNSFAQIVDYLRSQRITIKPNYTHIAATAGRGMAASQLFSLETPVHGIRVAPRTHTLVIAPNKVVLKRRPDSASERFTYGDELSDYLNVWVSRFETLITNPNADFTAALTGGIDSRTNLALIQAARNRLGPTATPPNLYCGSTPQNRTDFEVATSVAKQYNLNVRKGRRAGLNPLTAQESYEQFRSLALGVYFPLYMPAHGPSTMDINISGGGGGVHKKIYELQVKHNDVRKFIRGYSRYFERPEYRVEFIHDGNNFLRTVIQPGEDPLRVLLREGRVRYHTGRSARYGISLSPLHSVAADLTQRLAGSDRTEDGQFHYDVMYSLLPDLIDMPFDEVNKAPTKLIRQRLTAAKIHSDASPGRVWAAPAQPARKVDNSTANRISVYKEAFDKSMGNAFVKNFWKSELLDLAQLRMDTLSSGQGYGDAANGKAISSILTTDLVKPV